MDAQNWTTRLAYTNILQILVHLVAKKTKLHYNNNKKGFSNLIKNTVKLEFQFWHPSYFVAALGKFMFSKKATKIDKIFTVNLTSTT